MSAPPPASPGSAAPKRAASLRNVFVNLGWLLGGKGVAGVLSLVYLGVITRSLGVEGFGQFSLASGTAQAVASFAGFQSWQIIVRYGMPHLHADNGGAMARLIRFTTILDIVAAIAGALLTGVVMLLMGRHFGWTAGFTAQATALGIVLVLATHWTPLGVLRIHDRYATGAAADTMTAITRFIGALIVWATGPSVIGYLLVWAVAEVVTAAAYWIAAARVPGVQWRLAEPLRWRTLKEENPGLASYTITTNLSSSLDLSGKQVAVLLVGLFVSPAAAGAYRVAQQLAQALGKISQLLTRALFPELVRSRSGSSGERDFERLLARTMRLTAGAAATIFLVVLLLGKPAILLIAGRAFGDAYPLLLLLGSAGAVDFAAVGLQPALVASGRPELALKLQFVSTAALLGLIALLSPLYGARGAAIAVLGGSLLSFAMLWRVIGHRVRRNGRT